MPRRRSTSSLGYLPLIVIAILLLLWVAGIVRIQVSPQVNVPPEVQTPEAQVPEVLGTLAATPQVLGTRAAAPSVSAPTLLGQRTKTSGCVSHNALPDSACTPGAILNVSRDQICVPGYSTNVRDVPESEKNQVYAEYGVTQHSAGEYEVDHLVSLELGGSNDIANLWPEPAEPKPGFHEKDKVENYLHDQVCSGAISLQEAQREIASNWLQVYQSMPNK